jgi:hypothetical protein
MCSDGFDKQKLIDLIPEDVLVKIATLPVAEAGFGAGPGFCVVKRWPYDPPITLLEALFQLERYRELMKRCHVHFSDGSKLILERNQFLAFHPSAKLRRKHTAGVGPDGVIRERFRFGDFDEWPETLAGDIEVFKQVHRIMPNVLAASKEVFIEIDEAAQANREMVVNEIGEHLPTDEEFEISGFLIDNFEVEFVLMETTVMPEYLLIYDSDPSFDGEPFIIPGTIVLTRIQKAG